MESESASERLGALLGRDMRERIEENRLLLERIERLEKRVFLCGRADGSSIENDELLNQKERGEG